MLEHDMSGPHSCPGIGCSGSETPSSPMERAGTESLGNEPEKHMKQLIDTYAARLTAGVHSLGVGLDPDVLMLPGGSVIALALWLYEHRPKASLTH